MSPSNTQFDVIIVGGGAAGATAAIGLARAGFATVVVEAAPFAGAENWSGCVYFTENLARPEILGPEGVEALAWERRLVERGFFGTDGHGLLGMTYRDAPAFRHCYTVLRPIYDQHLMHLAARYGAAVLSDTTVESLIREDGRVVGVCTNRGPLYADLVFLAEGDASHLVTREGYERYTDQRDAPKFLQGIKQVMHMPDGAIEEIFGVGAEEGIAYELLVRNATLRGRQIQLNMGGFLYTNRQSLSLGLVVPADNLHEHFRGDPHLLMEWFLSLPALQPWLKGARRGVFGAKIIRGGGIRDVPYLIDDGLAIGGGASAIGTDFPYPNFTGPATYMGWLISQAARTIRGRNGRYSKEELQEHYLRPLQKSHYWQDVDFLRSWPNYVKRTSFFFGKNLDLVLGSAYVWTSPNRWLTTKWINWLRLILDAASPGQWSEMQRDVRHLVRALRLRDVADRPSLGRLLLDGTVNALRDLFGRPRANVPKAGNAQLHYYVAGAEIMGRPPRALLRWFRRFQPILSAAMRRMYANDQKPLPEKIPSAFRLFTKQVNMLDVVWSGCVALAAVTTAGMLIGWDWCRKRWQSVLRGGPSRALYPRYAAAVRQTTDLTPLLASAGQNWESQLANLAYFTVKQSHIHLHWPLSLAQKNDVVKQGVWHVCPAHVYEARINANQQLQVVVNFENCIKCETCWRTSDIVSWARDGAHRFIYPVHSPVVSRLLAQLAESVACRPALPFVVDRWEAAVRVFASRLPGDPMHATNGQEFEFVAIIHRLLDQLERKLRAFDEALAEEPRHIDNARAEYLEMMARYAQQIAARIVEELRDCEWLDHPARKEARQQIVDLATSLFNKAEERARRTWDRKYAWAAADGRQIRFHHVVGLRKLMHVLQSKQDDRLGFLPELPTRLSAPWLRAEEDGKRLAAKRNEWAEKLDEAFPLGAWRHLEKGEPLSHEQDALIRDLLACIPRLNLDDFASTLHPPIRKLLLALLAKQDPSLAYRAATHLWARDLATLTPAFHAQSEQWTRAEEWACFAVADVTGDDPSFAEAIFAPAAHAHRLLILVGDRLLLVEPGHDGVAVEPLPTLGLRGAGLARLRLHLPDLASMQQTVDRDRYLRIWRIISSADLTSIANGMAELLSRRAVEHSGQRVQFPGLFHDEEARDSIGKFGAVKKMVAEIAARRYLIETLDHTLSPMDFSAQTLEHAELVKTVVAEALGTAPGSVVYNAVQVFGGTGYSEDDILSKFYRDAAAWRYLGSDNADVLRRHGQQLLQQWRPEGQRLAVIAGEADLFEQLVQRKALQAELDEIRNLRGRLREAGNKLADLSPTGNTIAEVVENFARQDAFLLVSKALLLRTHARLEYGWDAEVETALLRVWLDAVASAMETFLAQVQWCLHPDELRDDRPIVEPNAGPPPITYAEYLESDCPYDSGDFLTRPIDLIHPRYFPEFVDTDEELRKRHEEFRSRIAGYFGTPRPLPGSGVLVSYERFVEKNHRPSDADLEFCRKNGYFRLMIPKDLGGEGRPKVDYYFLTTAAQRLADIAISLTIQVNTSIGTTPVLLARDKDLPQAQKDLSAFVANSSLQRDIQSRLESLRSYLERRVEASTIEQAYRKLQKVLQENLLNKTVLRVLCQRFLASWQEAGQSGLAVDFGRMAESLQEASNHWQQACRIARELLDELPLRMQACDLFLRWVSAGQISAFALTEPSAGSDTARVATRARLRSVPVEMEPDGVLRFVPHGGKEPRYLLDASKLVFRDNVAHYRWSENDEPTPIRFDDYDYETDDPSRMRYYMHGSRRVDFTDIAFLRQRDGQLFYDYWELTGAKMWITNGRMAGIMCLYAKIDDPEHYRWVSGVTGFIVDRHAEGLVVGKDEEKMGQNGSPTNELSLQAVRVPRENMIGLEARGQVNALETLNVGRAGLAMSAMTQMGGLIDDCLAIARKKHGDTLPAWVRWRIERMRMDRFISEALAHETVGRFEHPQTRSVRMESAIAKMLVSELLHEVIELAEDIHGLEGQTQLHFVEKRKRDARVLNIYEGTNEIQRFFILKDLATEIAKRWSNSPETTPSYVSRPALALANMKQELRQRIESALQVFGQGLWQNPNLQANCFLLSEAVAWFKAADSTLARLAWLERYEQSGGEGAVDLQKLEIGRNALVRCLTEVRNRLHRFDEELTHLRRGFYAPEIRAASLLFHQSEAVTTAEPTPARLPLARPIRVLVIVELTPPNIPALAVVDGRLAEPYLTLSPSSQSALQAALSLRETGGDKLSVDVIAVGPKRYAASLGRLLSYEVGRVWLVATEDETVSMDSAASALSATLRANDPYDLILGGHGTGSDEEGALTLLTSAALKIPYAGSGVRTTLDDDTLHLFDADGRCRYRSLPAAVTIEPQLALRPFTIDGFLTGLARAVELQRWPRRIPARKVQLTAVALQDEKQIDEAPGAVSPADAAHRLLRALGLAETGSAAEKKVFAGQIADVASPTLSTDLLAIVAAVDGRLGQHAGAVIRATQLLASIRHSRFSVLVLAGDDEASQKAALGQLADWHQGETILLVSPFAKQQLAVRQKLLQECLASLFSEPPYACIGEAWTEPVLASLAASVNTANVVVTKIRRMGREGVTSSDNFFVETERFGSKVRVRQILSPHQQAHYWLCLSADAEVEADWGVERALGEPVQRWSPRLERFYHRDDMVQLLEEVKEAAGVARLSDAEFIVDVGFGVGNRDGYEAVVEPLLATLTELGIPVMVGGTRKVTEELRLLPADKQIGQSGVSVNPRILLAIGISGAPQHLNYIGDRATILAFNRDPDAPIMTLNQRRARPRVFPVVGDLFETVPAFTATLKKEDAVTEHGEPRRIEA
ncbi:MAG: hypothetical protein KatS3mg105_1232 [Gemmatales bacterium]|nr:MAG: hypothetical protein KatS3mg105_1232 [Gemmatales bacterium]